MSLSVESSKLARTPALD